MRQAIAANSVSVSAQAGHYKNFKVSTYVRAQDVARMDDKNFLESTWKTISRQVDIDKIYLETHRDAFIVNEKVLLKVKKILPETGAPKWVAVSLIPSLSLLTSKPIVMQGLPTDRKLRRLPNTLRSILMISSL